MGLVHMSFTEQGPAHSSNRLMRPLLWPSLCWQGLSLHGQALIDLSHHLNRLHIHYIESEMSTSGRLEMRMINKEKKKADNWAGKVKKPNEEYGTVIAQIWEVCGSNEWRVLLHKQVTLTNEPSVWFPFEHWCQSCTADIEVQFLLALVGAAHTWWGAQCEQ